MSNKTILKEALIEIHNKWERIEILPNIGPEHTNVSLSLSKGVDLGKLYSMC